MKIALCLPWYQEPPRYIRDAVDEIRQEFGIEDRFILEETAGMTKVRGRLANDFLRSNCDVAICFDADITPTVANTVQILAHAREHDVVSGNYWKRDKSGASWVPLKSGKYENNAGGGVVECKWVGLGFAVIRRSAFEKAAKFCPQVDGQAVYFAEEAKGKKWLPEDYSFCERVRSGGGSVVVDTSVLVGHVPRKPEPVYPPEWAVEFTVED